MFSIVYNNGYATVGGEDTLFLLKNFFVFVNICIFQTFRD